MMTTRRPRPFGVPPRVAFWIGVAYQLATTALLVSAATRHAWGQVTFYGCLTVAGLFLAVLLTGVLILDDLPNRGWVSAAAADTDDDAFPMKSEPDILPTLRRAVEHLATLLDKP